MMSNKKRKLNSIVEPPQLSAFAARKAQQSTTIRKDPSTSKDDARSDISQEVLGEFKSSTLLPKQSASNLDLPSLANLENNVNEAGAARKNATFAEGGQSSNPVSRAKSPEVLLERPLFTLSTFKPSKDNVKVLKNGSLSLKIAPSERLIILGQYEISVQKGQITILGSVLHASKSVYRVYAAASHALPVIRCPASDVEDTMIRIKSFESGLESLSGLSPLFGKLWNEAGPLGQNSDPSSPLKQNSTFQILFSSKDGPQKSYLQPIISAPEWNEMLSKLPPSASQKPPVIMLCGPKSSGKSTFAKLLANRMLSSYQQKQADPSSATQKVPGVALLDLDPGQPEYSSPGQISLIHITEPNFAPPYSHPMPGNQSRTIRAHAIGAVSPSSDPNFYMSCALDLFAHYRNLLSLVPGCPLIINTAGWVLGTGLELLVDLISGTRPTNVIYMSQDGPSEVVESLREAAKGIPLYTLPSQVSEYTTRTAAHLRTMQSMSYFHLDPKSLDTQRKEHLSWSGVPLTSVPPWEIRYSGETPGILGIICYGEQPPADLLADTINGSILSVVVIEDMTAIPGWDAEIKDSLHEDAQTDDAQTSDASPQDPKPRSFIEKDEPQHLERPLILRTPENISYFNPSNTITLNPKYSYTIGSVLVRGIDSKRKRLQVLTPIPASTIAEISEAGKSIVLVSGKIDTPGWAYIEELVQKTALEKAAKRQNGVVVGNDEEVEVDGVENEDVDMEEGEKTSLGEGFSDAPWVETLTGSQGRGVGARVWRVRRDLGRTGDGD